MDLESCSIISKSFVGNLISRLRTMAKKPTIDSDIGTVFDHYLKHLGETQIYLNNGICTISFAEAALLIDCGAFVYGRKVDLLWDETIKHQKRMLSYDCNDTECTSETARLEERLQKYRRKRRKVEEKPVETLTDEDEVQQFIDSMANIDKNVEEEDFLTLVNDEHFLKTLDLTRQNYTSKLCSFGSTKTYNKQLFIPTRFPIYVNDEYLCCNTQLFAERLLFSASEYNSELHYREGCNVKFIGHHVRDNLLQQYICEKNVKVTDFDELMQKDFDEYIKSYMGTHSNIMYNFQDRCKKLCPRRSSILLTRLPEDVVQNYLDKEENQTDDRQNVLKRTSSSEHDNQPAPEETSLPISTLQSQTSSSCSDVDSGFNESAVDSLNGLSQNTSDDNPPTCHTNSDSNSFEQDSATSISSIANYATGDVSTPTIDTPKDTSTPNAETCASNVTITNSKTDGIKTLKRKSKLVDDETPKRKKRIVVFRWLKTTTTNLRKYEKFYRENYKTQDGEGNLEDLSDLEDDINSDIGLPEQNDADTDLPEEHGILTDLPQQNCTVTDSLESNRIDTCVPEQNCEDTGLPEHNDTDSLECNNTPEEVNNNEMQQNNEVPCTTEKSITNTAPHMDTEILQIITDRLKERQQSQRKYLEWKHYIEGKIAESSKDSFDIHSYSAKLLNTLSKSRTMKFGDMVRNNSATEVVRYFVSTLDLVKDRNVEVSGIVPGCLANDTFQMKLLSMERHHEKLDEYQAPSKATLKMNLARIHKQKLNRNC